MLVEVRVQSLALDHSNNTPLVILKELDGDRILPIWIGDSEAGAIAMHMADLEPGRPLTHDLLCSLLQGLGGSLEKVVITKVEHSTYYAELLVRRNGEIIALDARPSDSIALAMRAAARIFANEGLLNAVTIELAEAEGAAEMTFGEASFEVAQEPKSEELEERLRRLNPEDFGRFKP